MKMFLFKEKLKFYLLFVIYITIKSQINAQETLDFNPKTLQKEIKNTYGCDTPMLVETTDSESLKINGKQEKYYRVFCSQLMGWVYIGRVATCRAGICFISSDNTEIKNFEYFDYFILFDSTARILSINIYNYQATHGYEITIKSWLKQFIGYDGTKELIAGKDIDAISGATISVNNLIVDVCYRTKNLKYYINLLNP